MEVGKSPDRQRRLPTLGEIASQASTGLYRKSVLTAAVLFIGAALALAVNIWPSYRDLQKFQDGARTALADRNQELVRAAVEQAAGNTIRILGAAESAVQRLAVALSAPPRRAAGPAPLERDFYPGGRYVKLLEHRDGYPDGPVTFKLPQIKLRNSAELPTLSSHWQSFAREAQALHASHPELKWLYIGTPGGNFLVFPASPMIPAEFDPRSRPWYKSTLVAKRPSWITPYYTAGGNDLVLTLAQPASPQGALSGGVVGVDVTLTDIVDGLLTTPFCDRCMFYLVNDKGEVLGKRGDRTQGESWKQVPPQRLFRDEMKESMPAEAVAKIAAVLQTPPRADHGVTTSLSRSPKARLVSAGDAKLAVYSAPIESLGWSLVGTVPRGYGGNDGERVLSGAGGIASDLRILMIVITLGIAATFIVFLLAFLKLSRAIQKSLTPALDQFASLEESLERLKIDESEGGVAEPISEASSLTREHEGVVHAVQGMQVRLAEEAKDRERKAVYVRLAELGGEFSHSIRNALQNINTSCGGLERLAAEEKAPPRPMHGHRAGAEAANADPIGTIRHSVGRIDEELERFRSNYRAASSGAATSEQPSEPRLILIDKLVRDVVSEHEIGLLAHIRLLVAGFSDGPEVWAFVRPAELRAALSNLIQNAVEAMEEQPKGILSVTFIADAKRVLISVSDTGPGIPANVLPHIFDKNFTYGKPKGTGLGLYQAKQAIEWIEGRILAESSPGKGATFTIELLQQPEPTWLTHTIELPVGKPVAVIDDDPSMLAFWKERLSDLAVEAQFFRSIAEASQHDLSNHVVVLDQQFGHESETGLTWLAGLKYRPETYLCTAAYEDNEIQAEVEHMGLRMLPKSMIHKLTVKIG